jgi:hypothetical protein
MSDPKRIEHFDGPCESSDPSVIAQHEQIYRRGYVQGAQAAIIAHRRGVVRHRIDEWLASLECWRKYSSTVSILPPPRAGKEKRTTPPKYRW